MPAMISRKRAGCLKRRMVMASLSSVAAGAIGIGSAVSVAGNTAFHVEKGLGGVAAAP